MSPESLVDDGPPRGTQPLKPPLAATCQLVHEALSLVRVNSCRAPLALVPTEMSPDSLVDDGPPSGTQPLKAPLEVSCQLVHEALSLVRANSCMAPLELRPTVMS